MPRRVYPNLLSYFREHPEESMTQVARELGCSLSYLSMIAWRHRQPALPLALRIASRCNVPLESLIRSDRSLAHAG